MLIFSFIVSDFAPWCVLSRKKRCKEKTKTYKQSQLPSFFTKVGELCYLNYFLFINLKQLKPKSIYLNLNLKT